MTTRTTDLEALKETLATAVRELMELRARAEAAERERDQAHSDLKAYVEDTAVTCAYCGARKDRPVTFEDIKAHVSECPKHPMSELTAENRTLRAALESRVEHMVQRFLTWKLPADFSPDAGISFKPAFNEGTPYAGRHEPTGTNLLNATQAEALVRHMLATPTPPEPAPKPETKRRRSRVASPGQCKEANDLVGWCDRFEGHEGRHGRELGNGEWAWFPASLEGRNAP